MAGFEMQLDVVKILAIMQPLFQNPRETLWMKKLDKQYLFDLNKNVSNKTTHRLYRHNNVKQGRYSM
jgi:hypothetical protein